VSLRRDPAFLQIEESDVYWQDVRAAADSGARPACCQRYGSWQKCRSMRREDPAVLPLVGKIVCNLMRCGRVLNPSILYFGEERQRQEAESADSRVGTFRC
jgi:hypothetical protein